MALTFGQQEPEKSHAHRDSGGRGPSLNAYHTARTAKPAQQCQ
jgi:hypothetical protein